MALIKTTIGNYLLKRTKELGIDTIFGLPGDFNMKFLDLIEGEHLTQVKGNSWLHNSLFQMTPI